MKKCLVSSAISLDSAILGLRSAKEKLYNQELYNHKLYSQKSVYSVKEA